MLFRHNIHMKHTLFFAGFLLVSFFVTPPQVDALSCMDPASMLEYYQNESQYTIFTAVAGETKEFDKPGSAEEFEFAVGANGYTGQYVEVSTVHKGSIQDSLWVYHQKDATWGYLCASGPVTEGESALFIVNQDNSTLGLTTVVNSYPVDSSLAQDIIETVDTGTDESIAFPSTAANWKQDLAREIKEAIFVIRIKFTEWRFWHTK